ncbi:bifunctional helix-turn-helix transcriptional regulator/GNAT family N-acetyltransferase [Sphingomonas prati]|uniref:DNA-binding MarR family transcriptional regulator/N-acetylglutamate synthase-like GNAT family acetyltransferase n=1 Tax=Sphingomonas prati TaxID=1843237 RepID=A0A7W9BUI9_9SPHN|nr:helix-turn-helix domain-containing GNAT family N-acetyltransferase [Sphingomonas prati]MBB5730365.1 DNA-binding MarR family transcriptional regulator/N-acetylglutamate synthase-like GNAT family acetyltransferase [Sphingomonas prati]GGE93553.1 GNAT family N-acetyltransferase [Sphingomonas prati]
MDPAIEAIRTFNRFFTRHVGAIDARFLDTEANLPEARLLFEIARQEPVQANLLQAALGLDRGYLSRMIARFEDRGWIMRDRFEADARTRPIRMTEAGREAFDKIDQRQRAAVAHDLNRLDAVAQDDLVQALTKARLLLDPDAPAEFIIRSARIGEVSQVAARQSILYAASHGWGRELETLEAETTAAFLRRFKPGREECWVADLSGTMAGAVFLTDEGDSLARLRLLHVEPFARRRGIGGALVDECVRFARDRQYDRIILWTHTVLDAARRIYAHHGFECIATEVHHEFGEPVQGETWQLRLTA